MGAIMGAFHILWIYCGVLITSRPVIIWNAIVVCINFLTVGAYAYFVRKEKHAARHMSFDPIKSYLQRWRLCFWQKRLICQYPKTAAESVKRFLSPVNSDLPNRRGGYWDRYRERAYGAQRPSRNAAGAIFRQSARGRALDKLEILPAFAFRMNGNMALVTARVPKKLTPKTRRIASRLALLGKPSSPSTVTALFTRKSSRPSREAIHSAAAEIVSSFERTSGIVSTSIPFLGVLRQILLPASNCRRGPAAA
jgi:hypothetical protein